MSTVTPVATTRNINVLTKAGRDEALESNPEYLAIKAQMEALQAAEEAKALDALATNELTLLGITMPLPQAYFEAQGIISRGKATTRKHQAAISRAAMSGNGNEAVRLAKDLESNYVNIIANKNSDAKCYVTPKEALAFVELCEQVKALGGNLQHQAFWAYGSAPKDYKSVLFA